jgi:hypothetical protein
MKTKLIVAAMVIATLMSSCNEESAEKEKATLDMVLAAPEQTNEEAEAGQQIPIPVQQPSQDTVATRVKAAPTIDWNKKIIKTASVKLEVKQLKSYNNVLHEKIKRYGAYIAGEDNFFAGEKSEVVFSIKVPVENFESLMNDLALADTKIIERSIKSEDVSTQVVDTKSRLEAKKEMRVKYLEFLKQSKNMAEVLQVQAEINSLQEEIEAASGRIQYLNAQSAYSTINLTIYEPLPGFKAVDTTPSFFASAAEGFNTGADFLKNIILGLITIWPLLIIGFVAAFVWRRNRVTQIITTKV